MTFVCTQSLCLCRDTAVFSCAIVYFWLPCCPLTPPFLNFLFNFSYYLISFVAKVFAVKVSISAAQVVESVHSSARNVSSNWDALRLTPSLVRRMFTTCALGVVTPSSAHSDWKLETSPGVPRHRVAKLVSLMSFTTLQTTNWCVPRLW